MTDQDHLKALCEAADAYLSVDDSENAAPALGELEAKLTAAVAHLRKAGVQVDTRDE